MEAIEPIAEPMRVVLAAGGTGGHLFPAEAVARALHPARVTLVTDERGARFAHGSAFETVLTLASPSSKGYFGKLVFLWGSFFRSLRFLYAFKPQVVWGFGGLATLPVLLAAWVLRIPRGIHQADRVLGKTNHLLSYLAETLAITFPVWTQAPRQPSSRIAQEITGLPVRPDIEAAANAPYPQRTQGEPFHLLVLGGSQGATVWGTILPTAVFQLSPEIQQQLQIVHQCPQGNLEALEKAYQQTHAKVTLTPFVEEMAQALVQSHVVFARSGASTLAELSVVGRPVFLVPYPSAMDDHQTANAAYIVESGGGWMLPQADLTPEKIAALLGHWISSSEILEKAAQQMGGCLPSGGAARLAALIVKKKHGEKASRLQKRLLGSIDF
ncbi:MAG: UDP-N-acetylglucosamine--N-acetylmuramyl-(pentapeptide) pyrophosphoryl-undecaprenol N-acetylglucosamine transferase [Alphaproteobacteria bacterium]